MHDLSLVPNNESLTVVATGSYIGEGFDQKRFDTLLLAAPVSFEGTLSQYVGRLHRENDGKTEVRVYDYIDVTVPLSAVMYRKRLKAYANQGYSVNPDHTEKIKLFDLLDVTNNIGIHLTESLAMDPPASVCGW